MKKKMTTRAASRFLKPIMETLLASMSKAKACASTIKLLFSMLRSKKLLMFTRSVSRKLQLPVQGREEKQQPSKDVVLFQAGWEGGSRFRFRDWWPGLGKAGTVEEDEDEEDDYDARFQLPDLLMTPVFEGSGCIELDEEEEGVVNGGSVVQAARSSRVESGEEFRLEDEIDLVADLFIRRFYLQQRMQRQISWKSKRESN